MKYRQKFLTQCDRFAKCCTAWPDVLPTELGYEQFHRYESHGISPDSPDPYYEKLIAGKKWWEWTVNQYAEIYLTPDWIGWHQLRLDFHDDADGYRQICQRIGVDVNSLSYLGNEYHASSQ
jgi:hypothetical protein